MDKITVRGWVRTSRFQKKVGFLKVYLAHEVWDYDFSSDAQIVLQGDILEEFRSTLGIGMSVEITGQVVASPGSDQEHEIVAEKIKIFGDCDASVYPIQKKDTSAEFLRTIPHLRCRTEQMQATLILRSWFSSFVREYFEVIHRHKVVHTPVISFSDCEGAGEAFKVTKSDGKEFYDKQAYLTVSGQLEAEALCMALGPIYTFGPTFRAEKSSTPRHTSEFWMIEPEIPFVTYKELIAHAIGFIKYMISYIKHPQLEDQILKEALKICSQEHIDELISYLDKDIPVISHLEAQKILVDSGIQFEFPVGPGESLQTEHEKYLAGEYFKSPVVVTHYPSDQKAFYMKQVGDGTAEAFDLLVPKVGELIGGSMREDKLDVLKEQMALRDIATEPLDWFLDLRRYGSVPHGGYGVGFERLLMWLFQIENIKDTTAFPK